MKRPSSVPGVDIAEERSRDIGTASDLDPCPLCGRNDFTPIRSIRYDQIWRRLREARGVEMPKHVAERHSRAESVMLVECGSCGLQYFSPLTPGDGEFYAAVSTSGITYYETDRWEFGLVRACLDDMDDVLDVGCGQGDFLRSLGPRRGRTVGVDHNPNMTQALGESRIEAVAMDVTEFAEIEPGAFDVVCTFQTLEHLAALPPALLATRRCLRPGGRFFASVPNRDRTAAGTDEPLDCPPHHMSRWHHRQFAELASRYGFELVTVTFEPPRYGQVEEVYFEAACKPLRRILGAGVGVFAARVYRKLVLTAGWYRRGLRSGRWAGLGMVGHTMMAEFRRPQGDAATGDASA